MKTKNGMVTLQVPEGDLKGIFTALDARANTLKNQKNIDSQREVGVELAHTRQILTDQAMAQGWKSM